MQVHEGRSRVVIASVGPEIDCGRFPIKRTIGEQVAVNASIFTDSHDLIRCVVLHRPDQAQAWSQSSMTLVGQDRWQGAFSVSQLGRYRYTVQGWVDRFHTWRRDLRKRLDSDQDVRVELLTGAEFIEQAGRRAAGADAGQLQQIAEALRSDRPAAIRAAEALDEALLQVMEQFPDRSLQTTYHRELLVVVDPVKARFSAWYELFPRSCAAEPGRHGTLRDCARRLPYVASMGFDVLYLPPIHPIGVNYRKGKNNAVQAQPDDVGSPWAIGAAEGGHKAIHPQLGTLADFHDLVNQAKEYGIDVALDIALQCSPDHPYVKEHPEWFRRRPDGTVQYAENPPKKYQDIYPFDFETQHWRELWEELKSIFTHWVEQGVRVFRVDNPHTKPFAFWEWLIAEVQREAPGVIFLSEAFARPAVMYELAKRGFTQSYTYFSWRNTSWELKRYFEELTKTEVREFLRPNLWPNTPDILPEYLQIGGRPAFVTRAVLAATLGASYGVYGPAFELFEGRPREHGSEEYFDSEKYELRHWDIARRDSLAELFGKLNRIRRDNPALHSDANLEFHPTTNEQLICYSKQTGDNAVVVIVNLDPFHTHSGWVEVDLERFGVSTERPFQVHELLGDTRYLWQGKRNYVELNPQMGPAHVFRVRRWVRTEHQFEYFM